MGVSFEKCMENETDFGLPKLGGGKGNSDLF